MTQPVSDPNESQQGFANRLLSEKSPYLLQHAHNPVDWYPWGEEAFAAARDLDRPIFLSVGYSACHWCHVMERESFENAQTAQLLNREFVSIKVDREERPDVDEVYMTAVQMTTGSGGWPMSVFLLPDGRPFYGGTYFPPESRQGRIGFPSLLTQLADAYRNRRGEVDTVAASIAEDLRQIARQRPTADTGHEISAVDLVDLAVEDMVSRFDSGNGGFGGAPKFPPHHALRLLTLAARHGNAEAPRLLITTLDKMALGGIYDHVGGGFHRYATDAVWLLPHFEKMLYDNALLARVYAEAHDLTGKPGYARIAREICDWVLRDLAADEEEGAGGFYAALDADSEGVEGRYYVWTPSAVVSVVEGDSAAAAGFCRDFHIRAEGNFRDEATGRVTGENIPYLSIGQAETALPDSLPPGIQVVREALRQARYLRTPPATDYKVITAWNGLMIGALARTGALVGDTRYVKAARRAADFCLSVLRRPDGSLLRRYAKGSVGLPGFLDDYAFLGDGLVDLYEATRDDRYLTEAQALARILLDRFWDAEDSGFFYTGAGQEILIAQTKDLFDGALPSANGVAARLLVRLGLLPDGDSYGSKALAMLSAYRGTIYRAVQGTQTLVEAMYLASPLVSEGTLLESKKITGPLDLTVAGPATLTLRPGAPLDLVFLLRIAPGFHVNARYPNDPDLIPTTAKLTSDVPASLGPVEYPEAIAWESGFGVLSTYQGEAHFRIPVTVVSNAYPGRYAVEIVVSTQACSETECLAPATLKASVLLDIPGSE